jgi:hypothetical protein
MRLNDWAKQSHVVIEGFNGTSQNWYQIWHCPSGTDGPVEWREFSCEISVPKDTTAMRMILNGGWSTSPNNPATTWFDNISVRSPGSATGANTSSPAPQDVQPQVDRESSAACQSLGFIVCPGEPTTGLFG